MKAGTAISEVYSPACSRFILEKKFEMFRFPCRYGVINLSSDVRARTFAVHRLVGEAFLGRWPATRPEVNHKSGNFTDNRVGNIERASTAEAKDRAKEHELTWRPRPDRRLPVASVLGSSVSSVSRFISGRRRRLHRPKAVS